MTIPYNYTSKSKPKDFNVYTYNTASDLAQFLSAEVLDKLSEQKEAIIVHAGFESTTVYVRLESDAEKNRRLGAKVFNQIASLKPSEIQYLGVFNKQVMEGLTLASYKFEVFKTKDKSSEVSFVFDETLKSELENLKLELSAVFWSRDLVNLPYSHLNTAILEQNILDRFKDSKVNVQFLDKEQLIKDNFGGVLAVNQASDTEPRFGILEYKPQNATNRKPIVLVGKGIVYDTGGLSLKPTPNSMDIMKCDMGGLATVVGTMDALASLEIDKWVVCLVPITDNLIGNKAIAPGDVITMRSGTTVEVMNTDAEGRLILADALDYAKNYRPELVIDVATLTGSALGAFGHYAGAIMGNATNKTFHQIHKVADQTGERIARMPFWEDYKEELESTIADIKNLGSSTGGAITAGKFLEHFVGYEWLHLDIAGPAFFQKPIHYNPVGGTGYGVRLLTTFIKEL